MPAVLAVAAIVLLILLHGLDSRSSTLTLQPTRCSVGFQEKQAQKASANSDDEGDRGKETRARSSLSKLQEPAGSSKRKGKPMRSRT